MARTWASNLGSRSNRKSPPHLLHFPAQDLSACWAKTTTPQTSFRGMRCSVIAMNWLSVVMPVFERAAFGLSATASRAA